MNIFSILLKLLSKTVLAFFTSDTINGFFDDVIITSALRSDMAVQRENILTV